MQVDTRAFNAALEAAEFITEEGVERFTGGGIKAGTARNWRSARKGPPYYRANGRILYKKSEVLEWIEARRVAPELAAA